MDPFDFLSGLTIDQHLDSLEKKFESYSSDQVEWTKVNHHMERVTRILVGIKNRYNTFAPIHQLPGEIMLRIYHHMQRKIVLQLLSPYYDKELEVHSKWLVVTKVCHHWRRLALSCRSLWRNILISPGQKHIHSMQSWFTKRATPMTLHIHHEIWRNKGTNPERRLRKTFTELQSCLSLNGERVEMLYLQADEQWQGDVEKMLNPPLPSLSSLSLTSITTVPHLPQILGGKVSKVKHLYLNGIWCWPANTETFRDITHLVLVRLPVPLSDFLIMLRACPHLETLHMKGEAPKDDVIVSSDFAQLPTPRLKTLVLESECHLYRDPSTESVLQYLNLSPITSIYIETSGLVSLWLEKLASLPDIRFEHHTTTLEIKLDGPDALFLHQGHLVLCPPHNVNDPLTFLAGHLHALTELTLEGRNRRNSRLSLSWTKDEFARFLEDTPELHTIRLKTPGLEYASIMEALSKSSAQFRELRIADESAPGERVEIIDRHPLPSYRLIFEPPLPPRHIADTLDPSLMIAISPTQPL